jgi:hypothetical protein
MQEQYNKIRDQLRRLELMIFIYGNELCDEVRLKQLVEEHRKLDMELLDIMTNNPNIGR